MIDEKLREFLAAHPGQHGVASTDAAFLDWESNAFSTNSTPAPIIPNGYIVQLKSGTTLVRRGQDEHAQFHKRAQDIDYSTRIEFKNTDLFFGLSIQVKDGSNLTTIEAIPNVLKVWPIRLIPRPMAEIEGGTSSGFNVGSTNFTATAGSTADVNSPHKQTGVDRLHNIGIKGTPRSRNVEDFKLIRV